MAIYPNPDRRLTYAAINRFVEAALQTDDSIFTSGTPIWSLSIISDLYDRFVKHLDLDESKDSFTTKLQRQLDGAPSETIQLAAEVLFVQQLTPYKVKGSTKRKLLDIVLGFDANPMSVPAELHGALEHGLVTDVSFNIHRPHHMAYILEFARGWKGLSDSRRVEMLEDPWIFKRFAESVPAFKAPSQRAMICHFAHPNSFEPITNLGHKQSIWDAFGAGIANPPEDIDQRLLLLRPRMEAKYGKDFHYYHEPIRSMWSKGPESENDDEEVPAGVLPKTADTIWMEITKSSHKHGGAGWEFGTCLWSPTRAKGGRDWYAAMREVKPGDLVIHHYDSVLAGFSVVEEEAEEVAEQPPSPGAWAEMGPYYRIALKDYRRLPAQLPVAEFVRANRPQIAKEIKEDSPPRYPFVLEGSGNVKTVQGGYLTRCTPPLYQLIRESQGGTKLRAYTVEMAMDGLFMSRQQFEGMLVKLRRKKNLLVQGPPGVGKTFVARRVAYALIGVEDPAKVQMVQFHQSYAYEDFVRGWRPTGDGGFELQNGVFYWFCRQAEEDPQHPYVFIIDEINRGNLSKVFGELMMLIEPDKRGSEYAIPLTYRRTPDEVFSVPPNLHIIGLMNTADRSLAMVDYALRRRFAFEDLRPEFKSEGFGEWLSSRGVSGSLITKIVERMEHLNGAIASEKDLGAGFAIGHSFLCLDEEDVADHEHWYRMVVESEIGPLLREYWFDDPDRVASLVTELLE